MSVPERRQAKKRPRRVLDSDESGRLIMHLSLSLSLCLSLSLSLSLSLPRSRSFSLSLSLSLDEVCPFRLCLDEYVPEDVSESESCSSGVNEEEEEEECNGVASSFPPEKATTPSQVVRLIRLCIVYRSSLWLQISLYI